MLLFPRAKADKFTVGTVRLFCFTLLCKVVPPHLLACCLKPIKQFDRYPHTHIYICTHNIIIIIIIIINSNYCFITVIILYYIYIICWTSPLYPTLAVSTPWDGPFVQPRTTAMCTSGTCRLPEDGRGLFQGLGRISYGMIVYYSGM